MIESHILFAIVVVVLAILRYVTYFYTIYKGETKPHAFSWLLWGAVTGVGTIAQFALEAGPSAWALGFVSVSCLFIAFLAFFIGDRDYKKSDWCVLFVCALAIPVWKMMDSPLLALVLIICIDSLSYWPTVRKSYFRPDTEPPVSYLFAGSRYFFMLLAVPDPNWENLMYPFFLMCADCGVGLYIMIRRAQLGYPVHEYKKA